MKTENNLENKTKFFAQYWGQHLIIMGSFLRRIDHVTLCNIENDDILQLKPLSKISDEDAIEGILYMYNLSREVLGEIIEIEHYDTFSSIVSIDKRVSFKTHRSIHHWNGKRNLSSKEADFLRSKAYALPYMDLSVEDLIDYSWIKLEE